MYGWPAGTVIRRRKVRFAEHLPNKHDQTRHGRGGRVTAFRAARQKMIEARIADFRRTTSFAPGTPERAVAFDGPTGRVVLDKSGSSVEVAFRPDEIGGLRNTVFIHSHPAEADFELSGADMAFAVGADLAEMHALSATGDSVIKRPKDGWFNEANGMTGRSPGAVVNVHRSEIDRGLRSAPSAMYGEPSVTVGGLDTPLISVTMKTLADVQRGATERTAKFFGWEYEG